MKIAIIGGGAAGFFSAIQAKANYPSAQVTLFEKTHKPLAKVKISGGGRCNVTNGCTSIKVLSEGYPRGGRQLKKAFRVFDNQSTQKWFESRGVKLKTEPDNRVFPQSDDSQTIVDCLQKEVRKLGIVVELGCLVEQIVPQSNKIKLSFKGNPSSINFDKVIIATGGSPKRKGLLWLESLGHQIEDPVPSLFTFNMPKHPVTNLMGVSVQSVKTHIQGTKLAAEGPLLITHWGMSGPAILKLSALGARQLSESQYQFSVQINWSNTINNELVKEVLTDIVHTHPKRYMSNLRPYDLPERLWLYLLGKVGITPTKIWGELGKKGINRLTNILTHDIYEVKGKTTFKEEFVTCGGVALDSIHFNTMESKVVPNLYFAGEVLDIDGITGGYNFQAAWTTAFIAGQLK